MRRRWLVKTTRKRLPIGRLETRRPFTYEGITSPSSLARLKSIREDDLVLLQHTGPKPRIVGLARAASRFGPRRGQDRAGLRLSDLEPLARPVSLEELREVEALADWELLTFPRLAVVSVPLRAWRAVLARSRRDR